MDLRSAVSQTLASSPDGIELLLVPRRFMSYLADLGLADTPEYRVLRDHANDQLLEPFFDAIQSESSYIGPSLRSAASKTADRLSDTWVIDKSVAESLCDGIAAGVADYLGIPWTRTAYESGASAGSTMRREPTVVVPPKPINPPEDGGPASGQGLASAQDLQGAPSNKGRSRTPLVVALVALVLVGAVGGYFALSNAGQTASPASQSQDSGESAAGESNDEVNSILASAKQKADQDDYESAYKIVKDGLKQHPDSAELKAKADEYQRERDEIEDVIDRAQANVSSHSYDRALDVIEEGLETYPNSQKLKNERASIQKAKDKYESEQAASESSQAQSEAPAASSESTEAEAEPKPEPTQEATPAPEQNTKAFPAHWSGSYTGNSLDAAGNHVPVLRKVWFDLTENNGVISGTCSVGNEDGSDTVDGQFTVTGTYDRQTGSIAINGESWVFQGDLWGMRNFWGTVAQDMSSMSGTCIGLSSGETSDWSATAG